MSDDIKADMAALVPRLRRFAYSISGNQWDGDDLVQSACVKALDRLEQYRPGTRLDSWMFRIIQTTYIDETRSRQRGRWHGDRGALENISDDCRSANQTEDSMLLSRVRREIAALPVAQRAVVALVAIEGFSYKEAAATLEVPVGTIMSRLARARSRLIPLIEESSS